MTDVRLTAVNPEDSQVYPVACNDKGELLLDSGGASGDLDVTGNLTVAGNATFASTVTSDGNVIGLNPDTHSWQHYQQASTPYPATSIDSVLSGPTGSLVFKTSANWTFSEPLERLRINSDGSAEFAGTVVTKQVSSSSTNGADKIFTGGVTNSAENFFVKADGSGNFAGPVTAPNITFKIAPATAAAMPAPLIDEGFTADNEVDLLTELIKMKLQIRDLNAFMQRTLQDGSETTQ